MLKHTAKCVAQNARIKSTSGKGSDFYYILKVNQNANVPGKKLGSGWSVGEAQRTVCSVDVCVYI